MGVDVVDVLRLDAGVLHCLHHGPGAARAVQVGTQNFTDTRACPRIIAGLSEWCDRHGVERVADLTDTLTLN